MRHVKSRVCLFYFKQEYNMADINYIHYGNEQIDQQALLNSLANNVQNYVASQPWSRRRKEKFMSAYSDILSKGVQGASNDTGQWMIDVGGNVDLDSISKKDKEMYLEAAYFIQQQMASLPTLKKEEEKKEELPVLTNSQFQKDFGTFLTNQEFGGSKERLASGWKGLDTVRDAEGKLSTKVRRNTLANALQGYRDSLKDNQYNFEGSPFVDLNTFKTRLDDAIAAIRSDDPNDDNAAFNKLGLNATDWFDTGLNDDSGKVDSNGNPLTYGQLAQLQKTQAPSSNQTASVQKQNPLIFRTLKANFVGKTPQELKEQYGDQYSLIEALNKYSYGDIQQLNSDQKREIFGAMKMAKNNISDDLYNQLVRTPTYKGAAKNRFKVIEGVDNYIYDVKTGNIIQVQREELADQETDLFSGIETDAEKLERRKQTTIGDNGGLTDDMIADLTAMGLDAASAGAAFIPGYGTLASAVTGVASTVSGAVADRMRGESWGSTLGTAGFGLSMDILGLIPGIGIGAKAAKIAKIVSKGAKWIGPILGGMGALAYGPGAMSAFGKFTSGRTKEITAEELRDFTYAMRAIATGAVRNVGATVRGNREVAKALTTKIKSGKNKGKTIAELTQGKKAATITTKNGKSIELTDEEFKTLKSNANREDKINILKAKGVEEKDIDWAGINPAKWRFKTADKSNKISGLEGPIESSRLKWNTTAKDYQGIKRFSNQNLLRNYTSMQGFDSGLWRSIKNYWTGQDILNKATPTSSAAAATKSIKGLLPAPKAKTTTTTSGGPTPTPTPNPIPTPSGNVVSTTEQKLLPAPDQKLLPIPESQKFLPTTIKMKPRSNRGFSSSDQREINNWIESYNLSSSRSKSSPKGGYKGKYKLSSIPEGQFGLHSSNGDKIMFDRDLFGNITITIGDKQKSFKDFSRARQYMSKQLYSLFDTKKINYSEMSNILRSFKQQGILKQGGRIDKQKIQKYKDFINK